MNSASAIKFLYAAYVATWLIHALYIGSLLSRYRRAGPALRLGLGRNRST